MARRSLYERKTHELFAVDLDLVGKSYKNVSNRVQKLKPTLRELQGVQLSTGVISSAKLERTKDGKDFKIVIRKGSIGKRQRVVESEEYPLNDSVIKHQNSGDTQAKELVQYFHSVFHHINHHTSSAKAISQAATLIAQYGYDAARFIVDFSYKAAPYVRT